LELFIKKSVRLNFRVSEESVDLNLNVLKSSYRTV